MLSGRGLYTCSMPRGSPPKDVHKRRKRSLPRVSLRVNIVQIRRNRPRSWAAILGQRRAQVCAPIWLRALSQGQDRPGPRACAIGNCRIWHAGSACLASPSGGSAYQRPRLGAAARAGWAWLIAMPVGPDHGASGRPSKDWQVPPPHQQDAEIGWRLARPAAPCTGILIHPFGSPLPGTLARRLQTSARTRPRSPLDRASATR
jgi:hypothetical protein